MRSLPQVRTCVRVLGLYPRSESKSEPKSLPGVQEQRSRVVAARWGSTLFSGHFLVHLVRLYGVKGPNGSLQGSCQSNCLGRTSHMYVCCVLRVTSTYQLTPSGNMKASVAWWLHWLRFKSRLFLHMTTLRILGTWIQVLCRARELCSGCLPKWVERSRDWGEPWLSWLSTWEKLTTPLPFKVYNKLLLPCPQKQEGCISTDNDAWVQTRRLTLLGKKQQQKKGLSLVPHADTQGAYVTVPTIWSEKLSPKLPVKSIWSCMNMQSRFVQLWWEYFLLALLLWNCYPKERMVSKQIFFLLAKHLLKWH